MNLKALMLCAGLAGLAPALALAATDATNQAPAAGAGYADAEVKKIDVEQGKIVLKHGPIDNLGMPGMTMVFRADAPMLAAVKVGDRVRFKADKVDGAFKLTELLGK